MTSGHSSLEGYKVLVTSGSRAQYCSMLKLCFICLVFPHTWEDMSSTPFLKAVVITDPFLVAAVLDKANAVEKNSKAVYSKFNVVRDPSLSSAVSSLLEIC